jgi:aminopeptidase N
MDIAQPLPVRLKDYRPPAYRIAEARLEFDLDEDETRVKATLTVLPQGAPGTPLVLDGEDLTLHRVAIDGETLPADAYQADERSLTLPALTGPATVEIETSCRPKDNTRLEGLYVSHGTFCTQCEAEGFRRITYFLDRPDVMAVYTTVIRGPEKTLPVLLSNGNLTTTRDLGDGRHEATWHDPHPKPSYLFALVAGELSAVEDHFTTASGREVNLRIYVEPGNEDRCAYAMDALKRAMRWDEEAYGLEYDLDLFNIVAISHFNMGAMENKSLNVFNAKYILADPDISTDMDYALIESIVAHEYFHNWTGNRVTCRDWFQLSLKEGLTVFRDQQFSADMRSAPVKRIEDVRALRARQFAEDAGPLSHPVRPPSYIEINNFYTATVYEKGAEVVRMLHTLLGAEIYRKGIDLYVERHDGEAATCDDFLAAMADASGRDLSQFALWYDVAGTPELSVSGRHHHHDKSYELIVRQSVTSGADDEPGPALHIPLVMGLLDRQGKALPLRLKGEPAAAAEASRVLEVTKKHQVFHFMGIDEPPVASLNRGFSAPVRAKVYYGPEDSGLLMARDGDPFNRWEASQQFASKVLLDMAAALREQREPEPHAAFLDALARMIDDTSVDPALLAEALALPSEDTIANQMKQIDVEAIYEARERLRHEIAERMAAKVAALYQADHAKAPYSPDAAPAARRALRNRALWYLAVSPEAAHRDLVGQQYDTADNMTDRMAPLAIFADWRGPERDAAFADFERRFTGNDLAMDKWLGLQAASALPETLTRVEELMAHPAFSLTNPNKVRALIGRFAAGNPLRFHAPDGAGYRFLADRVIELDPRNPQVAARLLQPLGRWRRFAPRHQNLMRKALERVLATPKLSRDVYEIASKSLG